VSCTNESWNGVTADRTRPADDKHVHFSVLSRSAHRDLRISCGIGRISWTLLVSGRRWLREEIGATFRLEVLPRRCHHAIDQDSTSQPHGRDYSDGGASLPGQIYFVYCSAPKKCSDTYGSSPTTQLSCAIEGGPCLGKQAIEDGAQGVLCLADGLCQGWCVSHFLLLFHYYLKVGFAALTR
jgi:hypothetical protein